jgi:hypothetical protein
MSAVAREDAIASHAEICDVTVCLSRLETYCLDEWIERQAEPQLSRAEAIRRLMRIGLSEHPGQ